MSDVYCMFSFRIKGLTKSQAAWIQNAVVSLEMAHNGIEEMSPSIEEPQPLSEVDLGDITPFPLDELNVIFPVSPEGEPLADRWYNIDVRLAEEDGAYSAIFNDDECTAVEGPPLIQFLCGFAANCYHKPIAFEWAIANLGAIEGGFGGGAVVIGPDGHYSAIDTDLWMSHKMKQYEVPA